VKKDGQAVLPGPDYVAPKGLKAAVLDLVFLPTTAKRQIVLSSSESGPSVDRPRMAKSHILSTNPLSKGTPASAENPAPRISTVSLIFLYHD
jgi:hypothetical protein